MSSLPDEKISELRQAIHGRVSEFGIREKIRTCLSEALAQEGGRQLDEEALLKVLDEKGLVEQVMVGLDLSPPTLSPMPSPASKGAEPTCSTGAGLLHQKPRPLTTSSPHMTKATKLLEKSHPSETRPLPVPNPLARGDGKGQATPTPPPSKRCVFVQVLGGRAFLDHFPSPAPCPHSNFTLHLQFRGQRYHSRPVPCACEPDFREGFLLELSKHPTPWGGDCESSEDVGRMITPEDALSLSDAVQIALTSTNHRGEVELVGTYQLEWRPTLCEGDGKCSVTAELCGVGPEAKITPGILDLRLDLVPCPADPLHPDLLAAQLSLEKQRQMERERLFLVYAKQWWKEFLQLRPDHAHRLVKIFAPDEAGVSRPVCGYVGVLRAGRLLDSPRHAARFVSLIPFEKTGSVGRGAGVSEMWMSGFALLVNKKGDCEAHACLLCSLLLGFGLDAYVCIGTKAKALAHAWVMILSQEGGVVFWESITGQKYVQPPFDPNTQAGRPLPLPTHPYRTLGCVFNYKSFYANCQPSDSVSTCQFDLTNSSLWKAMSSDAVRSVSTGGFPGSTPCPLLPATGDPLLAANEMERQLRVLTFQHREDLGLTTMWDDDLCYLLSPALSAYETERCLGVGGVGNEEFQEAIRNSVPEGHTFKGFPIQLLYRNPRKAFTTCLQSPVCAEILACRGDQVRLALRVKVHFYPENVCAVWIMFAVKYRSVL